MTRRHGGWGAVSLTIALVVTGAAAVSPTAVAEGEAQGPLADLVGLLPLPQPTSQAPSPSGTSTQPSPTPQPPAFPPPRTTSSAPPTTGGPTTAPPTTETPSTTEPPPSERPSTSPEPSSAQPPSSIPTPPPSAQPPLIPLPAAPPPAPPKGSLPPAVAEASPGPGSAWTLTASNLKLGGSRYHGYSEQVVDGKKVQTLHFTVQRLEITDLVQKGDLGNGKIMRTSSAPGGVSTVTDGPIELYTQQLNGTLTVAGYPFVPTTLAPETLLLPDLDLSFLQLPDLSFKNAVVNNVGLVGGKLTIPGATIRMESAR